MIFALTMLIGFSCSTKVNTADNSFGSKSDSVGNEVISANVPEKFSVNTVNDAESMTESAEFYYDEGKTLAASDKYRGAIKSLTRAIKKDSNFTDAFYMRGLMFALLKDYTNSISDFSIVLEIEPESSDTLFARGNSYLQTKRNQQAIDDFDKALKIDTKMGEIYALRAMAHFGLENYTRALKDINEAIKLDPNEVKNYKVRILLVNKTTEYSNVDGINDLEKIAELEKEGSKSNE